MIRISTLPILAFSMLLAGGCMATPKVVESWKDPGVTGPLRFKKILVIAIHPDPATRRAAEDELVRQIGADRAIPAGQVLTSADRGNREQIKAKIRQSGVDGVVTVGIGGSTTHASSSREINPYSYDSFWNNYNGDVGAPDRTEYASYSQRVISIRTQIYSVADEKLVWEGISESFDPKDTQAVIGDVVKAVTKRLRQEHLIE